MPLELLNAKKVQSCGHILLVRQSLTLFAATRRRPRACPNLGYESYLLHHSSSA